MKTWSSVQRGMHVEVMNSGSAVVWTVLDRHPQRGCWWLHRRDDAGEWVTDFAHYKQLNQVPVKV